MHSFILGICLRVELLASGVYGAKTISEAAGCHIVRSSGECGKLEHLCLLKGSRWH